MRAVDRLPGVGVERTGSAYIATGHRTVASVSYVTGSHNVKLGIDRSFGWARVYTERQANLIQSYQNNRPTGVTVFSTPGARDVFVNYDLGITRRTRGR